MRYKPGMSFYLLIIRGDVEPQLKGPFPTSDARDRYALTYRHTRDKSAEDGLYPLDQAKDGKLSVDAYSGGFFEGEK